MTAARWLMVGDPHVEAGDLDDLKSLLAQVEHLCVRHSCPPLFLGDQYDTHAIVHAEVMKTWWDFFARMRLRLPSSDLMVALVGNHDAPVRTTSGATAMLAHLDQCRVVSEPQVIEDVLFMPYVRDPARFVAQCREHGQTRTVVCHQEFDGSVYENGTPAIGAAKPEDVPQEHIISGHIHAPAQFGKVWHPGAPRWRVEADAEVEERHLWLVEFEGGVLVRKEAFPTSPHVRRIRRMTDSPSSPVEPGPWPEKDDVRVDVRGPRDYVEARAPLHEAAGALVRRLPTAARAPSVRESEGVAAAWGKWVSAYDPPRGTPKEELRAMLKERVGDALA